MTVGNIAYTPTAKVTHSKSVHDSQTNFLAYSSIAFASVANHALSSATSKFDVELHNNP